MAVSLSALRAVRALLPINILIPISDRGRVSPRAIVRLEGSGKLKHLKLITFPLRSV
jgi:hypothetical protein